MGYFFSAVRGTRCNASSSTASDAAYPILRTQVQFFVQSTNCECEGSGDQSNRENYTADRSVNPLAFLVNCTHTRSLAVQSHAPANKVNMMLVILSTVLLPSRGVLII
ncbi:unnamed protein product [Calicophoron daubneyi]|uniref:Uncharacterized protein n=1 Tax=Calicophoron daubneyi TaxID=300641 RepID=A0AAV2T559_CALDB